MPIEAQRFEELMKRRHLLPPPGGETTVTTVAEMAKVSFDSNIVDCSGIASLSRGLVLLRGCHATHVTSQPELSTTNYHNGSRDADILNRRFKQSAELKTKSGQPEFSQALFVDYHNVSIANEDNADFALKNYEKHRERLSINSSICVISVGLPESSETGSPRSQTPFEQRLDRDEYVMRDQRSVTAGDTYRRAYRRFLEEINVEFAEDVCVFLLDGPVSISFWEPDVDSETE